MPDPNRSTLDQNPANTQSAPRMIRSLLRKTAAATLVAALAAATLIAAFSSSPASTQNTLSLLSATGCTDGTFVDTSTHPVVAGANNDLVDDCLTLVALQNHWATAAINNNNVRPNRTHPLKAWGTRTQKIDTWTDITVSSTSSRVTELYMERRQLAGSIPAAIGNLTGLTYLTLGRNHFTGSIPAELGNLTNLQLLSIGGTSNTNLTGSIPAALGKLTNLSYLVLSGNNLTGSIPAALGKLTNLVTLSLSGNKLTGSIPAALSNLAPSEGGKLTTFNLCGRNRFRNRFTGPIPTALRSLVAVQHCVSSSSTPSSSTSTTPSTTPTPSAPDTPVDPDGTEEDGTEEEPDSGTEDRTTSSTTTTTTTTTTSTTTTVPGTVPGGDGGSSPLWNTLTIEQTGTTPAQIRQTLGLASNQAIYAWDAQTQTWQRLTNPNLPIPADTVLTFRTGQAISQENLDELNLARGTQRTTLAAGWNIISIPEAITRTSDSTGFLLADELTDCDANAAVIAIANYSAQAREWQIWLPCHTAVQTLLTTGPNSQYRPLTAIAPADTTYIYSRSAQTIAWNSDTQTYQTTQITQTSTS